MSWIEKRDCEKSFKIKTIDKKFADIPKGSRMLIASPPIIDEYVKSIHYGEFIEPGLIENIAQTGAIRAGYMFSKLKEEDGSLEPPIGYIGAIKSLKIAKLPKVGDHIKTTLSVENQVFDITMVKGVIELKGEVIASCHMKIFVQDSGDLPTSQ